MAARRTEEKKPGDRRNGIGTVRGMGRGLRRGRVGKERERMNP